MKDIYNVYYSLLIEARRSFPHNSDIELIVTTSDEDIKEFSDFFKSLASKTKIIYAGVDETEMEKSIVSSIVSPYGKITLKPR